MDNTKDLEYFQQLWKDSMPHDGMKHTKETWDKMALTWKNDPPELTKKKQEMVVAIVDFLKTRGILNKDASVIDIGCGSGNYCMEFAKHAKNVLGTDISEKMIEYCVEDAKNAHLTNAKFLENDFLNADLSSWKNKFDLVFTSLTPAMSGLDSVKMVNEICRGYCFNNSFVYRRDTLRDKILVDVFNKTPDTNWGNSSPYCLYNILWLLGYYPEVTYYKEVIDYKFDVNQQFAFQCAKNIIRDREPDEETVTKIFEFLNSIAVDGKVDKTTESLFAWTFWESFSA